MIRVLSGTIPAKVTVLCHGPIIKRQLNETAGGLVPVLKTGCTCHPASQAAVRGAAVKVRFATELARRLKRREPRSKAGKVVTKRLGPEAERDSC
jgi:hypothetical protein